jgi:hypothetical protein
MSGVRSLTVGQGLLLTSEIANRGGLCSAAAGLALISSSSFYFSESFPDLLSLYLSQSQCWHGFEFYSVLVGYSMCKVGGCTRGCTFTRDMGELGLT